MKGIGNSMLRAVYRLLFGGTEENHEYVNSGHNPSQDSNRTFLEYNTKALTASSRLFGASLLNKQARAHMGL